MTSPLTTATWRGIFTLVLDASSAANGAERLRWVEWRLTGPAAPQADLRPYDGTVLRRRELPMAIPWKTCRDPRVVGDLAMATPWSGKPADTTVSVIIPVLDEAAGVPAFRAHWQELQALGAELLFVDGGSADGTAALLEHAGFTVLRSARGRARQMNAGAARARGDILLFLHADTRLPAGALELVRRTLQAPRCWGRFDVEIVAREPMLAVVARCMNLRSRLSGIATGDQAIFVERRAFERVGGFPDQPLMEDVELSARLRSLAPPLCLKARVATSGRRWQAGGIGRTILLMWGLRLAYWLGVPAPALARLYGG